MVATHVGPLQPVQPGSLEYLRRKSDSRSRPADGTGRRVRLWPQVQPSARNDGAGAVAHGVLPRAAPGARVDKLLPLPVGRIRRGSRWQGLPEQHVHHRQLDFLPVGRIERRRQLDGARRRQSQRRGRAARGLRPDQPRHDLGIRRESLFSRSGATPGSP